MVYKYTWVRDDTRRGVPCSCGGTIVPYVVDPPRRSLNHVMVCDSPSCEQQVIHEGTDRERRGRVIIF